MRPSAKSPETVARIHDVAFFSLTSSTWDTMSTVGDPVGAGVTSPDEYGGFVQSNAQPIYEHPCAPLMKILSSGTFYYALSSTWDISSRLSRRIARGKEYGGSTLVYDDRFLWNEYIVRSLLDFRENLDPDERREMDLCQFIVSSLRGFSLVLNTRFSHSGACHPRICRCVHRALSRATDEWHAYYCYNLTCLPSWMEKSGNAFQYKRR